MQPASTGQPMLDMLSAVPLGCLWFCRTSIPS